MVIFCQSSVWLQALKRGVCACICVGVFFGGGAVFLLFVQRPGFFHSSSFITILSGNIMQLGGRAEGSRGATDEFRIRGKINSGKNPNKRTLQMGGKFILNPKILALYF